MPWTRLLYLYPSTLDDLLVEAVLATGVPYFDLSLQHVSRPLLKRMRRWGEGERFLDRIRSIRAAEPQAAFRSSFIVGYPGETEGDHDQLLAWIQEARLDWVGFFPFSNEAGTYAADLDEQVPASWSPSGSANAPSSRTRSPREKRERAHRVDGRGPRGRPGGGRDRTGRPRRSTASWPCPDDLRWAASPRSSCAGADGPDLVGRTGSAARRSGAVR